MGKATSKGATICARRILATLVLVLGLAGSALAHEQDPTALPRPSQFNPPPAIGTVIVQVRDASGAQILVPASLRLYSDVLNVEINRNVQDSLRVMFENIPLGEYSIEVRAPGYATKVEDATIVTPNAIAIVFVNLRMETGPPAATSGPLGAPLMAPKALKELNLALAAFHKNDLKQAQEHLDQARKLAPNHPDVHFMQGLIYLQQNNNAAAQASLEIAVNLYPRHPYAQGALGTALYRLGSNAAAITALEKAVEIAPQNWQSYETLALCYIRLRDFNKARLYVERALEISGDNAPELHVLLARVLIDLNQKEKARAELQSFLNANPKHPEAGEAQRLLTAVVAAINKPPAAPEVGPVSPVAITSGVDAAVATVRVSVPLPEVRSGPGRWAPPTVDDTPPVLLRNTACNLPEVLSGTAKHTVSLVENLERVTATEKVDQADLDDDGNQVQVRTNIFDYLVSITETRPGNLAVEENRIAVTHSATPLRYLTNGLGAMALIFHPYYAQDFEMRCEGLTELQGLAAWSVYFKQRPNKPSRIRGYTLQDGSFSVPLKGRAWIAANTFQVLRLETDLVEPVKGLRLEQEHLVIEYQPVDFKTRKVRLWLPVNAEMHTYFRGHRYFHHHTFTDYQVFSVETIQTIGEQKKP